MAVTEVAAQPEQPRRRLHLRRILEIIAAVVVGGALASLLGWDISGWFSQLWDVLTQISVEYVIAGIFFTVVKTTATATGWYWILATAYGRDKVSRRAILACYATAVALNGWLPANLGTLVSLIMFTAVIAGATFSGVLGGYVVQKIFYTAISIFVYLYLFLSVGGSFDIKFGWVREHWVATAIIAVGAVLLVSMLIRILRPKLVSFWENAKHGGQVLGQRRRFLLHVVWPQFLGWAAGLCVIGVFLAAYAIPVTFHTIMSVVGGNSIANVTSFTPGGVGVNQAFNVASLNSVTDATTATAYSVAQQLITTAWNQIFALVMLIWAFGWSGGKTLVGDSYADAKRKAAERKQSKEKKG
jgi:glycosyltransferase 2 family protein